MRHTRPDEEPDDDDDGSAEWTLADDGLCSRCGHDDHESVDCPTVVPYLIRNDE